MRRQVDFLLVQDDPTQQALARSTFDSMGLTYLIVKHGTTIGEAVERHNPRFVFVDLQGAPDRVTSTLTGLAAHTSRQTVAVAGLVDFSRDWPETATGTFPFDAMLERPLTGLSLRIAASIIEEEGRDAADDEGIRPPPDRR